MARHIRRVARALGSRHHTQGIGANERHGRILAKEPMKTILLFAIVGPVAVTSAAAYAQPAAPAGPALQTQTRPPVLRAFEKIDVSGNRALVTSDSPYVFTVEKARAGETMTDVLRRKGLSTDEHTLEAIKELNPQVEGLNKPLQINEKIHFIGPVDGSWSGPGMVAVSPKTTNLAQTVFMAHDDELQKLHTEMQQSSSLSQFGSRTTSGRSTGATCSLRACKR